MPALVILLVAAGCSKDDPEPVSKRPCAVVQAKELSKIVDSKLTLRAPTKGFTGCRFTSKGNVIEVVLTPRGPVEKGQLGLELTSPRKERAIGDEAYSSTENVPLGMRLSTRKAGSAVDVDISEKGFSATDVRADARAIAAAAIPNLPKRTLKQGSGPRGAAACSPYVSSIAVKRLGGKATGTPANPPGSCTVTLVGQDLTLVVTVLADGNANQQSLDALVAAVKPAKVPVGKGTAYWLPTPGGDKNGGQLTFLSDGRLLQVTVIGNELAKGKALELATAAAELTPHP